VEGTYAHLLVAAGAIAAGIAALLWALRVTDGARGTIGKWRERATELEEKIARADSIFGAHPGVVLIWEDGGAPSEEHDWGKPRVYGSPLALASLLRFSDEATAASDPGVRILQGLSTFEASDATGGRTRLAPALARLRREGAPFSLTISGSNGVFVELDGRTAGPRAVVWIIDAGVKGVEESGAQGRIDEARQVIARDPASFLEMIARAPFPAWRVSGAGKLEWANPVYLEALESKSLDQAISRNLLLDQAVTEQARRALDQDGAVEELRHVVIGGERRAMKIVMFPLSGGAGGMAFDITEAEDAREALAKHTRAHDETLDYMTEGVAIFGADKKMIFHNRAFAQMWNLEPGFLADRPTHAALLDHLKERRKLPAHSNYAEWRAGELALYQEIADLPEALWVLPEGRTLRVTRQRHPMGGLLLIFADRTDEVTLKGQYNALLQVQRAALDKLHEGIAVFGLDGRMKLSNAAFAGMWSLRDEEIEGEMTFDRLTELALPLFHDRASWTQIKARITDPSPAARQEYRGEMARSDGTIITFLSRPLPDGATLIAFLDVTATRNVEQALRDRAEAFEAADRLKTEFVHNVSYQLRTPLQSIQGYAEVLAQGYSGPLNQRQKDQIGVVLSASHRLSELIDNILDIAMIEAGRVELELGDVDLWETLNETAGMAMSHVQDTEVSIKIDCDKAIGALHADPKRIKQILFNLVSNSLRFTDKGDTITIGAKRGDGEIMLWVADSGTGIPYEQQAGAFDNFVSGDQRGAGLGLALVRSFVTMHDGWVGMESRPGEGTTVTCHFPLAAAGVQPKARVEAA
jgi:signal transduction histidine kinase